MSTIMNITLHDYTSIRVFGIWDYCIFGIMLIVSSFIGIFFSCGKKDENFFNEYILGGKTMKAVPVGISIAASGISAVTLIAVPAEVYIDNAMYGLLIIALPFICWCLAYVFLPMYFELGITSVFDYIELRYDRRMRKIISFLYVSSSILWLPNIIYIPALTMSQATGINIYIIAVGVSAVCTFYTTLGGVKAVVWTDFIQMLLTFITFICIIIIATLRSGGFFHIMEVSQNSKKLDVFQMDPSPFIRSSFWINTVGIFIAWITRLLSDQKYIQKFIALPSLYDTRKAILIYLVCYVSIITIGVYGGLITYSAYYGCDLIANKIVSRSDQVFPYLVMDKVGNIPTLSGFFIAGVLSAGLSSQSAILNTLSGTVYQDYFQNEKNSEKKEKIIIESLVVFFGSISVLMVVLIEKMGNILSAGYKITSFTATPVATFFLFGATVPRMNGKGALWGSIVSCLFLIWITIGSSYSQVHHPKPVYPGVPNTCGLSADNSSYTEQNYPETTENENADDVFILYKLSFLYYKAFGLIISLIVGLIVSYITGPTDPKTLNPKLIIPQLRRFLPKQTEIVESDETELKLIKSTETK